MAGIFGVASKERCIDDLFLGTFYLQHRAQDYCGLAVFDGGRFYVDTHKGLIRQQFPKERLQKMDGFFGIGCVSGDREPVSELSKIGGLLMCFDGNIINYFELKTMLLEKGFNFSGYRNPEEISDCVLISKIISKELNFVLGVKKLIEFIKGDFSIIALTKDGIYAARGWGRKPLILGKKDGGFAVSSESISFENNGFEIIRDVEPGEIVLLDQQGIYSLEKIPLSPIKYGTFEWVYNAYPSSIIDGKSVAETRIKLGQLLAEKYPIVADIVSPVPNSGRWHAVGYAQKSKIPYAEVFVRYDYSDRSYTPKEQVNRDEEARIKLIPVRRIIQNKKIILVDDSIVRGTQTLNQVRRLRSLGAKEIHLMVACPPLTAACKFGKTTRRDEDCIARRISIEEIRKKLDLDSLNYANVQILENAIGIPKEKLCLECWGVKN